MRHLSNYIDGQWVEGTDKRLQSTNPFTGEPVASAPESDAAMVGEAVGAARRAFQSDAWRSLKGSERAVRILALAQALEEQADAIARTITSENGKPIKTAQGEVKSTIDRLRFFASAARHLEGRFVASTPRSVWDMEIPEPVGVCGLIVPWNDPVDLCARKLGAALAAGCTVVIKPSEVTPASTTMLVEAVHATGQFPKGVVNLVHGPGGVTGDALTSHPSVAKISFTGSTRTGMRIQEKAAARLAKVSLECGGKSPSIVFDDADQDRALESLVGAAFKYAGQSCTACTRLLLQEGIYERFLKRFVERTRQLPMGDPMDPKVEIGPIACRVQFDKVRSYVKLAASEGGRVLAGGEVQEPRKGALMVAPAVFDGLSPDSRTAQEEIFGPVVVALPFKTEDEAVAIANNSVYGLSGEVSSADNDRAFALARRLRTGNVSVNGRSHFGLTSPFGGTKQSGLGRRNGDEGFREYLEIKTIGHPG